MSERQAIPADHPVFEGHFPGHPTAPGALLLALVVRRFEDAHPQTHVAGVRRAKFLRPVRPGEALQIEFAAPGPSGVRFTLRAAGETACEGQLILA
jgi:3-hydroxyacyl-[acyl-carrier-protein] dehydratase